MPTLQKGKVGRVGRKSGLPCNLKSGRVGGVNGIAYLETEKGKVGRVVVAYLAT